MTTKVTSAPSANTAKKLKMPLIVERSPPRGFFTRMGGGGAIAGLITSLGLRGAIRGGSFDELAASVVSGLIFRLPNMIHIEKVAGNVESPTSFAAIIEVCGESYARFIRFGKNSRQRPEEVG